MVTMGMELSQRADGHSLDAAAQYGGVEMIDNALSVQQRLMRHTEYNESSGCWEWFGSKRNGYGRMIIGSRTDGTRKSVSAHRIAYELAYGEIPIGMEVC